MSLESAAKSAYIDKKLIKRSELRSRSSGAAGQFLGEHNSTGDISWMNSTFTTTSASNPATATAYTLTSARNL